MYKVCHYVWVDASIGIIIGLFVLSDECGFPISHLWFGIKFSLIKNMIISMSGRKDEGSSFCDIPISWISTSCFGMYLSELYIIKAFRSLLLVMSTIFERQLSTWVSGLHAEVFIKYLFLMPLKSLVSESSEWLWVQGQADGYSVWPQSCSCKRKMSLPML